MSSRVLPKAGIYFSHYECFGHTSRAIAVAEVFKKKFPEGNFFFIQGGLQQHLPLMERLGNVYSLPFPFADRRAFRQPVSGPGKDAYIRTKTCLDILVAEKPDLFITESFPLGREESRHELIPILVKMAKQGTTLWAVAGYPLLTGQDNDWREKILALYKKIIIFSPAHEKNLIADALRGEEKKRYVDFFRKHEDRFIFAGYFLSAQRIVEDKQDKNFPVPLLSKGACRIAVVRGGGAYSPEIIAQAIRVSDALGKDYYFTIVAGPSTTAQEWCLFATLVAKKKIKNLLLLKSISDYEGLIAGSDICVCPAPYHTSVMLLKHKKKAVIIPFQGHGMVSCCEQSARAVMLKEMLGAEILSAKRLTAASLKVAIQSISRRPSVVIDLPAGWFNGAAFLENELITLF